ncbi:hypothetical protein AYO41_03610, partial [Verrucomicrobia bacterium SCGC AG-212-E04]
MARFTFDPQDFAVSFLSILFEGLPFLLLGALVSGLIEAFVPARWMTRFLPRSPLLAMLISGLLGLIFPMCECGVVPVIRRLIRKGLPASCAVTYMLSAPVISPVVLLSTYAAFNQQQPLRMMLFRAGLTYLVAVGVGLIVSRLRVEQFLNPSVVSQLAGGRRKNTFQLSRAPAPVAASVSGGEAATATSPNEEAARALADIERELEPTFLGRMRVALARGAADFLDVAIYVVIGAALTAVFNTSVPRETILPLAQNPWLSTAAMMGLAFSLALCSTSDAFIAATFTTFPFGAKLA